MPILIFILIVGLVHVDMVNEQLTEENKKLKQAIYGQGDGRK
ncbi:hypothetical protein [Aerococcus sp. Group 1]|nr:hypothetical protein [Aerococcus sp. Group 1]MCY3031369.1 hypothetical protein [Aerococcus sp. Group 1]